MRIIELKPAQQRKAIKIYNDAFKRQPVGCPTCTSNCCAGCAGAHGYFRYTSDDSIRMEREKKYGFIPLPSTRGWTNEQWDADQEGRRRGTIDHGYFRAGKGCVIPYKERSEICVSFVCHSGMNQEQRDAGNALYKLMNSQEK